MAQFETGTWTTQQSLLFALEDFAENELTSGWTIDNHEDDSTPVLEMHIGSLYVSIEGDGTDLAIYQALGYDGSGPGSQPDDSGNGGFGTSDRQVEAIGDSGVNYWFYGPHSGTEDFIYIVVEYATGFYRHFGFGELIKANDFTGGEFAYGGNWDQGNAQIDLADSTLHSVLIDAWSGTAGQSATVHVEGLPNEPHVNTKWGISFLGTAPSNDTAGVERWSLRGGVRAGVMLPFAFIKASLLDGLFPGIPVKVFADTALRVDNPSLHYFLGTMPFVRVVQMGLLDAKDTFSVGGETWRVFPAARKVYIAPEGSSNTEESWNLGIAYRES